MKNIFANDPHVQYTRCGMAIISRLSKIRKICENLAMQKFPGIRYVKAKKVIDKAIKGFIKLECELHPCKEK